MLSPPDARLQGEKAEIISGFATGSQDFSCGRTLGSAGIRAWWTQPDHEGPPGARGEPDPSTAQMGNNNSTYLRWGKNSQYCSEIFCSVPPFSPFNLDRDPIASKRVGGQRKEQDTTFISSILGFKCQKTKGRYKEFGRIFVYLVEKRCRNKTKKATTTSYFWAEIWEGDKKEELRC